MLLSDATKDQIEKWDLPVTKVAMPLDNFISIVIWGFKKDGADSFLFIVRVNKD